ncbi:MAG: triple tyrosine motif-containing protein [Candidatus Cryptobacteroides sp.]
MKRLTLTLALLFYFICCFGYYPSIRNFKKSVYKAGAQNWSIVQTNGGGIVAANTGVVEFDGSEWGFVKARNHSSVRSLYYDRESDIIYYGATNELGRLDYDLDKKMRTVSLIDSLNLSVGEIWAIHKIGDFIWFREGDCIHKTDFQRIQKYDFEGKLSCSTEIDGRIIVFASGKGAYMSPEDAFGSFTFIPASSPLAEMKVCSILSLDGGLLFVTESDGLFFLKDGTLSHYHTEFDAQLRKNKIFCASTNGRFLSFGTISDGVYIKDLQDGSVLHLNTASGMQNNTVLSQFFDKDGNLWLGLDNGIDFVSLSSPEYRLFGDPEKFGTGYASAEYDGKLYLGTNQGLFMINEDTGKFHDDEDIASIDEIKGQVWSLTVYDGRLFCCHDKGISIIHNGKVTRHIPLNGAWKTEPLSEHPDYLLCSTYDLLVLLKKEGGEWDYYGNVEGFNMTSKVFMEDKNGKIWLGHWLNGLFRLTIDVEKKMVTESTYFSQNDGFPRDWSNTPIKVRGEMIFSTVEGFYKYNELTGKAYPFDQLNSIFNSRPESPDIFVTTAGDIVITSPTMICCMFRKDDRNYKVDTLSLKNLVDRRPVGFSDIRCLPDNKLMVNTEDGFTIIRNDVLKNRDTLKTAVYVKEIYTTGQKGDSAIFISRSNDYGQMGSVKLPYHNNSLRFNVVTPYYAEKDDVCYSFLLENYDSDWSVYSTASSKEYTKLPNGKYVFRVRSIIDSTGQVSESSVSIVIEAPWYKSIYAYMVYILLFLVLVVAIGFLIKYLSIRWANQISQKREEEQRREQIKADLTKKAQDLAASTMNVIRKNEVLLGIDSDLEKMASYIPEDRNKSLKLLGKIRRDIRDNIQHDDIWQKFEKNFDMVYDDYLKRLSALYPQLTIADKKMCAYLKIGLSSKEIAPLLNLTVRSVEMTRYRLRKKLNLSHDDNLISFLQQF